jgi:signal transduction histidine kinase
LPTRSVPDRVRQLAPEERWLALFVMTRAMAVGTAVTLLVLHRVTSFDVVLAWFILGYGAFTIGLALLWPGAYRRPPLWFADVAVALALIWLSGDWRSPFYLLALTALAPPAAVLPFHLALPCVVTVGLAYAADVLRRLAGEQARAQRLAVETERRRIAWELHDSAKQRLHAAHLVLSSLPPSEPLELALEQLQGAAGDMETSIAELRSPLEGRPLHDALRRRAAELAAFDDGVAVSVEGAAPPLTTVTASHAYRILAEAMTNAVRHAGAREVRVRLGAGEDGGLEATVQDDGHGLPSAIRPGANGLRTMRSRAFAIGGRLSIGSSAQPGTRVHLHVPEEGALT